MKGLAWRRFGIRPRLLTPAALTLAAVLVSVVPGGLSTSPEATPFFALMAVHHWSIYRPELLPARPSCARPRANTTGAGNSSGR